jgi:hypothetical protein
MGRTSWEALLKTALGLDHAGAAQSTSKSCE